MESIEKSSDFETYLRSLSDTHRISIVHLSGVALADHPIHIFDFEAIFTSNSNAVFTPSHLSGIITES